MTLINVETTKIIGTIKPMHALNNGPYGGTRNALWDTVKEAGIPYCRLHDTCGAWGGTHYVDVENIFPDFSADENKEESYDFAFTDVYLKKIIDNGAKPFYRLGCTIENDHRVKAYHIFPPKNPEKWAKICEHIIMHYNEGWNNGFNYDIEYWEIWNEPDNELLPSDNPMWKGTREQFFELYKITSRRLKTRFPNLKIGGYSSCGFYEILNEEPDTTAHISSRIENFLEFLHEFMEYITKEENRCPLDFFSWHSYGLLEHNVAYTAYARKTLDKYGFTSTENILNEWNPGILNRGKLIDASNILSMMCALSNTSIDMLMYYCGQAVSDYCGIYNPVDHTVFKAYYAFKYFNEAYKLKNKVNVICDDESVFTVAAQNDGTASLIISNSSDEEKRIVINCDLKIKDIFITDETNTDKKIVCNGETFVLGARAIACVKF